MFNILYDSFVSGFYTPLGAPSTTFKDTEQLIADTLGDAKYVEPKSEKPKKQVKVKPIGKSTRGKVNKPPDIIQLDKTIAIEPNYRNHYRGNLDTIYGNPLQIHSNQSKYLKRIDIPYDLILAWNKSVKVKHITIHKKEADRFRAFFDEIHKRFNSDEIREYGLNLYGGSYNFRKIRGGNRYSTHAYGIAIDLNPAKNGLRVKYPKASFSKGEVKRTLKSICDKIDITNLGFAYGYDYMHFQTAKRS